MGNNKKLTAWIDRLGSLYRLSRVMPLRHVLGLGIARATTSGRMLRVYLKGIDRYVTIRAGTTDLTCLQKVFVWEEYKLPFDLRPRLIVDAGANIGMATIYYSYWYPNAKIVAIEPEQSNFEILRRNCENLPNVIPIQGALWPESRGLEIENPSADAWTFRVTEHNSNAGASMSISGITIADILERVRLLKSIF